MSKFCIVRFQLEGPEAIIMDRRVDINAMEKDLKEMANDINKEIEFNTQSDKTSHLKLMFNPPGGERLELYKKIKNTTEAENLFNKFIKLINIIK